MFQPSDFDCNAQEGGVILDCRAPEARSAEAHSRRAQRRHRKRLSDLGRDGSAEGAKVLLILEGPADLWEICWQLLRIGYHPLLDVRQPAEWRHARIRGAIHISGGELPDRIGEVPRDRPWRLSASVVLSLLKGAGREEIFNVLGGMGAWERAGLPTESSSNLREGGA